MEFSENQPIYLQIVDYFCENILNSNWLPNQKIPSVREIAVTVQVNPNTAQRAYSILQDKGVIYNKRGIGYFVSEDGKDLALAMRKEEFITKELPLLFRSMHLLHLQCDEIEALYKTYLNENNLL